MRSCSCLRVGDKWEVSFFNSHSSSRDSSSCDSSSRSPEQLRALSCSRAMKAVRRLFYSNSFQFFVTLTVSPRSVSDRSDYFEVKQRLSVALKQFSREHPGTRYLLVPDYHDDGAFHFHGFFYVPEGISALKVGGRFRLFKAGGRQLKYYSTTLNRLLGRNEFRPLLSLFGESSLRYVLKYVQKASRDVVTKGLPLYVRSRGLVLCNERISFSGDEAVLFENVFCDLGYKHFDFDYGVVCYSPLGVSLFERALRLFLHLFYDSFPLSPRPSFVDPVQQFSFDDFL